MLSLNSNYLGTPFTMAMHLHVEPALMEYFQKEYFSAFPPIPRWHQWTATQLQTVQYLITPFGRKRYFFGRTSDPATLREAVAYVPQSSTADRMNLGMWRVWSTLGSSIRLLAQVHDAIYFLYREEDEVEILNKALELIQVWIVDPKSGRRFSVPGEAKFGWNWCNHDPTNNPDGLMKFKGKRDSRQRLIGINRIMG